MILALLLIASIQPLKLTDAQRIAAKQAIERARYAFVIGDKPAFEKAYPHSVFEKQVKTEREREAVLRKAFGITITPEMLRDEYERIEKSTKAPEQWDAVKAAVKNNRRLIEEVVCRPLLVDRALHAKFDFDQKIHEAQHAKARDARAALMNGKTPAGATELVIQRHANAPQSTEEMLRGAQSPSSGARVQTPAPRETPPPALEPEAQAVLERELKKRGDVSTILEYRDRFEVYRLLDANADNWRVQMVRFPKHDFDAWYARARRQIAGK